MKKLLISLALVSGFAQAQQLPNEFEVKVLSIQQTASSQWFGAVIRNSQTPLADGTYQSLKEFYKPKNDIIDTRIRLATPILVTNTEDTKAVLMVNYSVSTGESGKKYDIAPSAGAGLTFLANNRLDSQVSTTIRFDAHQVLVGGQTNERPCVADYGAAGSYETSCRHASTPLSPSEAWKLAIHNMAPRDQKQLDVKITWHF